MVAICPRSTFRRFTTLLETMRSSYYQSSTLLCFPLAANKRRLDLPVSVRPWPLLVAIFSARRTCRPLDKCPTRPSSCSSHLYPSLMARSVLPKRSSILRHTLSMSNLCLKLVGCRSLLDLVVPSKRLRTLKPLNCVLRVSSFQFVLRVSLMLTLRASRLFLPCLNSQTCRS